ncbi:MAG: hypothetical protein RLZZ493_1246 [Bacteroidota bacterium]|jgi:hypothetical protein
MKFYLTFVLYFLSGCVLSQSVITSCEKETIKELTVFRNPDVLPKPKIEPFFKILQNNIIVDKESIEQLGIIEVSVVLQLIINEKGKVLYFEVKEKNEFLSFDSDFNNNILNMEWIPGQCSKVNVNTIIEFPIKFHI